MAKITKHKKDNIGDWALTVSAWVLIAMLGAAGRTHGLLYYFGGVVVAWFWGEAVYVRKKNNYENINSARMQYLVIGIMILFVVWFVGLVFLDPDKFLQLFLDI